MKNNTPMENMLIDALKHFKGPTLILDVSKYIWNKYEDDIRKSDEMLYKWQYKLRWAATMLHQKGTITMDKKGTYGLWAIKS